MSSRCLRRRKASLFIASLSAGSLAILLSTAASAQVEQRDPVTQQEVFETLAAVPSLADSDDRVPIFEALAEIARYRGIDFDVTPSLLKKLRVWGASKAFRDVLLRLSKIRAANKDKSPVCGIILQSLLVPLDRKQQPAQILAFSTDGRMLASDSGKNIDLWDVSSGKRIRILNHYKGGNAWRLFFSPDGRRIAALDADGDAQVWDVSSGNPVSTFAGHPFAGYRGSRWARSFSPNSQWLASIDGGGKTLRIWDAATGLLVRTFGDRQDGAEILDLAFATDGHLLVAAQADGVGFWDIATGREIDHKEHGYGPHSGLLSDDGRWLAFSWPDTLILWDLRSNQIRPLSLHDESTFSFSPDGLRLRSVSRGGRPLGLSINTETIWDPTSAKELCTRTMEDDEGPGAIISKPGAVVVASGGRDTISLRKLELPIDRATSAIDGLTESTIGPEPQIDVVIPRGTLMRIRPQAVMSSRTLRKGDVMPFTVTEPLMAGDLTVIKKGTLVNGRIVYVRKASRGMRQGIIITEISDVEAADGTKLHVHRLAKWYGRRLDGWTGDFMSDFVNSPSTNYVGDGSDVLWLGAGLVIAPVLMLHNALVRGADVETVPGEALAISVRRAATVRAAPSKEATMASTSTGRVSNPRESVYGDRQSAQGAIDRITRNRYRALPRLESVAPTGSGYLKLSNRTGRTLRIYLSGPVTRAYTLLVGDKAPKEVFVDSCDGCMRPGHYYVAAEDADSFPPAWIPCYGELNVAATGNYTLVFETETAMEAIDRIRDGRYHALPPLERSNLTGDGDLKLINGTGHAVQVYLNGPVSRTFTFAEGQFDHLNIVSGSDDRAKYLQPGRYYMAAEATNAPALAPFYGEFVVPLTGSYNLVLTADWLAPLALP